ncbi:MAG: hypothetical protein ACT4OM_02055 [Actinomycetota bacterium]
MRNALIVSVVGMVLLLGLGAAVAQLGSGGDPEADLAPEEPALPSGPQTGATSPEIVDTAIAPPDAPPTTTTRPARSGTGTADPVRTVAPEKSQGNEPAPPISFSPPPSGEPAPGVAPPAGKMVKPRPGMVNVHKTPWERFELVGERAVRLHFVSGVEPCTVLDRVEVDYRSTEVAITLFEGNDPEAQNVACIMIAQYKAVDVALTEPLNGRAIVDGAV